MRRADIIAGLRWLDKECDYLPCAVCDYQNICTNSGPGCAIILAAAKELEKPEPPWIPVTEDEPPTGTTLLLSVRDPSFGLLYTTAGYQGARWHDVFDLPIDRERITHWMLLPEPPEEEP